MASKTNIKYQKRQTASETVLDIIRGTASVIVFALLVFFPLYTHDMYFDILAARYVCFKVIVLIHLALTIIFSLVYLRLYSKETGNSALGLVINKFKPENILKTIKITDIFFIIIILSMSISWFGAGKYQHEAWSGESGRLQGVECWLLYFTSYILISRTFKPTSKTLTRIMDLTLAAGAFACVWGIMDYFYMDPFGFLANVGGIQKVQFVSSIGNLNTYTNYTAMIMALAGTMFVAEKNILKTIYYAICFHISMLGSMAGLSDNTTLSIMILFLTLPFWCFRTRRGFARMVALSFFFVLDAYIFAIWVRSPIPQSWAGSFFKTLATSAFDYIVIGVVFFAIATVVTYFLMYKFAPKTVENASDKPFKRFTDSLDLLMPTKLALIWIIVVAAFFVIVGFAIFDINNAGLLRELWEKLGLWNTLRISDDWGTHRGHNWRIAMENFHKFDLFKKLFGFGNETYLVISERYAYEEMVTRYGEVYDSAHNEYIQYLVCCGLVGLISYLGIFISIIVRGFKRCTKSPAAMACLFAVISYLFQATVNIAIPITTPVFFTLAYIVCAYAGYVENDKEEELA